MQRFEESGASFQDTWEDGIFKIYNAIRSSRKSEVKPINIQNKPMEAL